MGNFYLWEEVGFIILGWFVLQLFGFSKTDTFLTIIILILINIHEHIHQIYDKIGG